MPWKWCRYPPVGNDLFMLDAAVLQREKVQEDATSATARVNRAA